MSQPNNIFRLNVGFLVNQSVGYSRDFLFDSPRVHLSPDLDLNRLSGYTRITRTAQGLLVQVKLQATLLSQCVRCLNDFQLTLNNDFTELYAFSRNSLTDSDLLVPEDAHIDLGPLVREYMLLDVPISPLCSADCKGLCPICGENLNETTCNHDEDPIDPRMAVLKALLDQK